MVDCTLAMLASAASNPPNAEERVTPLHCLALVDPRALWFLVWTVQFKPSTANIQ